MVRTLRVELGHDHGTVKGVADQLGYGVESVRLWVRQADIDDGYCASPAGAARRSLDPQAFEGLRGRRPKRA
jgi:hypothetical protein